MTKISYTPEGLPIVSGETRKNLYLKIIELISQGIDAREGMLPLDQLVIENPQICQYLLSSLKAREFDPNVSEDYLKGVFHGARDVYFLLREQAKVNNPE